jgi:hypothetical protein
VAAPVSRFATDTSAPLATVPPTEDGPGMVPSMPTYVFVPPWVENRLFTRKRLMAFSALDIRRMVARSPQGRLSSMFTPAA